MRDKVKINILAFFTLFLSASNTVNGLNFYTTDNTEYDTIVTNFEEKTPKLEVKSNLKNVNIPKKQVSVKKTAKSTTQNPNNQKDTIQITGRAITLKSTNCNTMPRPNYSSANYCYFGGSSNLFVYGHNTGNIFGAIKNLKVGQTFKVTLNGKTTTYRVTSSFAKSKQELNSNSNLRSSIYKGYYLGKSDITIQTCEGTNDVNRRYVKAVAI